MRQHTLRRAEGIQYRTRTFNSYIIMAQTHSEAAYLYLSWNPIANP